MQRNKEFKTLKRQQFRRYYQPTRIVLGIVPADFPSGVNIITLCFSMYCSYDPPMMAFAVQEPAFSYELFRKARECVLSVPGETLAKETLFCGTHSGREVDKVTECGFELIPSSDVEVPGIRTAIANIELTIANKVQTGDHLTLIGLVKRFAVDVNSKERNLLSVGPEHEGYEVLVHKGIHRIGVVDRD